MLCRIADFNIEFQNCSKDFKKLFKDYTIPYGVTDFSFKITPENINQDNPFLKPDSTDFQTETSIFYDIIFSTLPQKHAILFHSSLIEVNGVGIAFTAHSGTGKTTHTLLWKKLLGDKLQIINGDKPIIRLNENGIPYGYGAPWCGKERLGINAKTPIKHICFIERSEINSCEKISPKEILNKIFDQLYIPKDPIAATNTFSLLNKLLDYCDIWNIKCNMDIKAAEVAYNTIFKENINET